MMLKIFLSAIFFHSIFNHVNAQEKDSSNFIEEWSRLDRKILLREAKADTSVVQIKKYSEQAKDFYLKRNRVIAKGIYQFPLMNYSTLSFRDDGNDYNEEGYDYFEGSFTKGHPAHDIMINDSDKDMLDDITGKPVDVVSMSNGIVFATDTTWKKGSYLRGGTFIKIFDVANNRIFYYSHLNKIIVKPGDIVKSGDKIGEVGRSGFNTIKPEGKTHLHVAMLKLVNGYPIPEKIPDIKKLMKGSD